MTVEIEIICPHCGSKSIKRNGKKSNGKQNYYCKDCKKQFIADHERIYKGSSQAVTDKVRLMMCRGVGVRDIAEIEGISIWKVPRILVTAVVHLIPQKRHYERLEADEFWTYAGEKKHKKWLIYAYDRSGGEVVAFIWGKRDYKTAHKLRRRLMKPGITYDSIATDDWDSFIKTFAPDKHFVGKQYTVGIEGNNCRLRHRIRRAFRRTCCFSKKMLNHVKAFMLAIYYINFGSIPPQHTF
jgi:IS1 family transposase/transposase-like protein